MVGFSATVHRRPTRQGDWRWGSRVYLWAACFKARMFSVNPALTNVHLRVYVHVCTVLFAVDALPKIIFVVLV